MPPPESCCECRTPGALPRDSRKPGQWALLSAPIKTEGNVTTVPWTVANIQGDWFPKNQLVPDASEDCSCHPSSHKKSSVYPLGMSLTDEMVHEISTSQKEYQIMQLIRGTQRVKIHRGRSGMGVGA